MNSRRGSTVEPTGPMYLLLIEDSPGDVRLTMEAVSGANGSVDLRVASDGVEAMTFLLRKGPHRLSPRPDLILLDLNIPRMDGRGVRLIPTVILTTSEAEADILQCHQGKANAYLIKPVQLDAFERMIKGSNDFWLTTAKLPPPRLMA